MNMSTPEYDIDPEIRAEFLDEASDGLASLSNMFIQLEQDPSDISNIEAIFRVAHSIKGNAAYFQLMKLKTLAHKLETLLDNIRKGKTSATSHIINVLLSGTDELSNMLERVRNDSPEIESDQHFDQLLETIISASSDQELNSEELFLAIHDALKQFQDAPVIAEDGDLLKQIKQATQNAVQLANELGISLGESNHFYPEPVLEVLDLLNSPIKDEHDESITGKIGELFLDIKSICDNDKALTAATDVISDFEACVRSIGLDPLICEVLAEKVEKLVEISSWKEQSSLESAIVENEATTPEQKTKVDKVPEHAVEKTMRIREDTIDNFLAFVGELVGIGEMYNHLHSTASSKNVGLDDYNSELRLINNSFDILSNKLQSSIMAIRKVPMKNILQRVPRIVRDIAQTAGKDISTDIIGQDLLVDKHILDTLESPLVHMVRNAADHGIEKPEVRIKSGKTEAGNIQISAKEVEGAVILSVSDDGKGLNTHALGQKAASLGLIPEGSEPDEEQIIDLLFASGVSTATEVTDVSGRGVGMNVVKQNIDEMNGRINVINQPGIGCEFVITLPSSVSTQIFKGLVVVVANQQYVIPLDAIEKCFRPDWALVSTIMDKGECIRDADINYPIIRLAKLYDKTGSIVESSDGGILVIVNTKREPVALQVNKIIGIKRVVLKSLDFMSSENDTFKGGALMGDGTIAMVIDVENSVQAVNI